MTYKVDEAVIVKVRGEDKLGTVAEVKGSRYLVAFDEGGEPKGFAASSLRPATTGDISAHAAVTAMNASTSAASVLERERERRAIANVRKLEADSGDVVEVRTPWGRSEAVTLTVNGTTATLTRDEWKALIA